MQGAAAIAIFGVGDEVRGNRVEEPREAGGHMAAGFDQRRDQTGDSQDHGGGVDEPQIKSAIVKRQQDRDHSDHGDRERHFTRRPRIAQPTCCLHVAPSIIRYTLRL